jgi:dTDP-4-amino-4,6-dideoxygalactose transaminase
VPVKVPIVRPQLGEAEASAASRTVLSGWITQGPEVAAFENEFAAAVGAPAGHAVAVANCTVALELALRCVGVRAGDDVVTVSHSFVATANSVIAVGARPVFCDVEEDTFGMDPRALERAITPKTRAIMAVHQVGMPCDLPALLAVAQRHGLPLIEDAACAIGSEIEVGGTFERIGKPHGAMACFSFHPRKIVTTGDGGMIVTKDPAHAARLRLLRQHAMSVPDTVRHHSDRVVFEEYLEPAYNYRLTDLQASVGRPQLARLAAIVAERRRLADRYAQALANNAMFAPPVERPGRRSSWQSYAISLREGAALTQIEAMQALVDRGIACRRGIQNAHQEPAYAGRDNWSRAEGELLRVSEKVRDTRILIPLFHGMTPDEQTMVIEALDAVATSRGK